MERTGPLHTISAALRRERERQRLSLAELARRAGIAKSTLSQLESGAGNPSVETLWSLAVALDVPFARLLDPPATPLHVVRFAERPVLHSGHSSFVSGLLAACPPGARRDLHVVTAEPGSVREAQPHINGAVEHVVVMSGRWRAGPTDQQVLLDPGDYLRFHGDQPHRYEVLDPGAAAVLIMEYT